MVVRGGLGYSFIAKSERRNCLSAKWLCSISCEFVHFQHYTKDFTNIKVLLSICSKYREGPAFARGKAAGDSVVVSKIRVNHSIRSLRLTGSTNSRTLSGSKQETEPTSSVTSQQCACRWSGPSSNWECSLTQHNASKCKNSGNLDHRRELHTILQEVLNKSCKAAQQQMPCA